MEEERCGMCPRNCLLSAPGCPRGMRGNGKTEGEHGHNHGGRMENDGSAESMIMEIGHRLHHGSLDRKEFLSVLSAEEKAALEKILRKVLS